MRQECSESAQEWRIALYKSDHQSTASPNNCHSGNSVSNFEIKSMGHNKRQSLVSNADFNLFYLLNEACFEIGRSFKAHPEVWRWVGVQVFHASVQVELCKNMTCSIISFTHRKIYLIPAQPTTTHTHTHSQKHLQLGHSFLNSSNN